MKETKKYNRKQITYIVILSLVIILFCTGYSIGKTMNQTIIKGQAQIAQPIIEIISNSKLTMADTNPEGECEFSVRNYTTEGKVTETNLQYNIAIKDTIDETVKDTVTFELYKNGKKLNLQNQTTEMMQLTNQKKQEDQYKLKVKYDKQKSNVMGDILDKVQIQVHSEQEKDG